MASGPTIGEGNGVREKQRFVESKVYTRKVFKGLKKNNNNTNSIAVLATAATSAVVNKEDNDDNRNKETSTAPTTTIPTITTATTTNNDDANTKSNINNVNDNNFPQPLPCTTVTDDENPTQQQLISGLDVASDGSSCLNRQQVAAEDAVQGSRDQPSGNGVEQKAVEDQNNNGLASRSKQNVRELRRKLESELEMVRCALKRIDTKQGELSESSNFHGSANEELDKVSGDKQIHPEISVVCEPSGPLKQSSISVLEDSSEVAAVCVPSMPLNQLSVSVLENSSEVAAVCVPSRPPNQLSLSVLENSSEVAAVRVTSRPLNQSSISGLENSQGVSDYVEKEKRTPKANQFYRNSEFLLGKDKLPPAESNKKAKMNIKKSGGGEIAHGFGLGSKFFKFCSSLLDKLIKHKFGWVFNAPVDVEGLGLHDYYTIIKHPMDLGTVKSRLNKNWYKSPKEFAEDVRLTFLNAMTYNPKGQDVHVMAEQLLAIFEDRWAIIEADYNREMRFGLDSTPSSRMARLPPPPPLDMRQILKRSDSTTYRLDSKNKLLSSTPSSRTPAPKKPKAKDLHKRDMTYEEKQKLSSNLQNLPSEKLDAILQIIKKRNLDIFQDDEEIEVDIDSVDAETLWELDRFVTNYKKSLSKKKRKAELALRAKSDGEHNIAQKAPVEMEVQKETKADENIVSSSVPVQGHGSSNSSSSSSDSGSSSSDSDSGSSSTSGSDTGS